MKKHVFPESDTLGGVPLPKDGALADESGPSLPWTELPPGFTKDIIRSGIASSGYPFQALVAARLSRWFHVDEEWPFQDRGQDTYRTLDAVAHRRLWNHDIASHLSPVRPSVALLVESKSSRSPWVFFRSVGQTRLLDFPAVAGLRPQVIDIDMASGARYLVSPARALGLDDVPFVADPPAVASVFTKAVRKGDGAELSGAEPFLSVVQPLIGAITHYMEVNRPLESFLAFDIAFTLGLFVTDAPLVLVDPRDPKSVELVPWVRVVRHEPAAGVHPHDAVRHWPIDCLHIDFLEEYITFHLLPMMRMAARRVRKVGVVLATGHGRLDERARGRLQHKYIRVHPDFPDVEGEHADEDIVVADFRPW